MAVRMLEVDPMSMITLFNGIVSMVKTPYENHQQIEDLLQRLYDLDSGYGLSARALVEQRRGNISTAVSLYYQVLELDPGRSSARVSLAMQMALLGFGEEAVRVAPDWAYNVPFFIGDWADAITIYRERYERDPGASNIIALIQAHAMSGNAEAAFPLAQELWSKFGSHPTQLGNIATGMTWTATKTEHPLEARLYRDAAGQFVQSLIEAGLTGSFRYVQEVDLAALDGREDDAIKAISMGLDNGMRLFHPLQHPLYASLRDKPEFQAQLSRQRDLIETDRREIQAMLCGPDTILSSWEPAPETCP